MNQAQSMIRRFRETLSKTLQSRSCDFMRRFRQQTWFIFAAIWLTASLSMFWSYDVPVAPNDSKKVNERQQGDDRIVRRQDDLDAIASQTQYLPTHPGKRGVRGQIFHSTSATASPLSQAESHQEVTQHQADSRRYAPPVPPENATSPVARDPFAQNASNPRGSSLVSKDLPERRLSPTRGVVTLPDSDRPNGIKRAAFERSPEGPRRPFLWLEGRIELSP